jgi:RNA polymerase sigma-70 factor (ECF subfamily)
MVQEQVTFEGRGFESVLAAAKRGEDAAWATIYEDLSGPVTGYLRTRGAVDADDLASETFLHVARNIHSFVGDEGSFRSFRSWVFVIAHRRLQDARRMAARRPRLAFADEVDSPRVGGDVEDEAIGALSSAWVEEVLGSLTEGQQDVLALRVVADLSLEETARVLDKRVGAVKAMQRRALNEVRSMIADGRVSI